MWCCDGAAVEMGGVKVAKRRKRKRIRKREVSMVAATMAQKQFVVLSRWIKLMVLDF